jgi:hypothetical protein
MFGTLLSLVVLGSHDVSNVKRLITLTGLDQFLSFFYFPQTGPQSYVRLEVGIAHRYDLDKTIEVDNRKRV